MKLKNYLFTLCLSLLSFSAVQAQWDCDCDFEFGQYICAADSLGTVVSVPNECFADCLGLVVVDEECDSFWEWEDDCDCPDEDLNGEGICIEIIESDTTNNWLVWVPGECYAACWGYEDYTVVECDDWGWEDDCECPEEDWEEGICIEVMYGDSISNETYIEWVPSECYADCWGYENYTIVECDDWIWGDDCECPEEDWEGEGICIEVSYGDSLDVWVEWVPSECYADCWGYVDYTVVECDDWGWGDDCECPEEDWEGGGICIEVSYGDSLDVWVEWVPSECYADCWGYVDYIVVECDNWGWEDDCECPEEDWEGEGICLELTEGDFTYIEWVPSECYADCWGYEDYTVVECDWGWEDDCECPEEDWEGEGICIEVTYGDSTDNVTYIEWVPSECYADCWGYEDYTVVECDWGWEDDCDCPEDDWNGEGICIELTEGDFTWVEWVPSECYADCWGYENYTVVDCADFDDGGWCDWEEECDCELDDDSEGICIMFFDELDTLIEWVPNECFADCWGFENYTVVDCEDFWNDGPFGNGGLEDDLTDCLNDLFEEDLTTIQSFLLALNECEAIELPDCIFDAPIFETDEEFFEYLLEFCPEGFGQIMDESDGPSIRTMFDQMNEGEPETTSTVDIATGMEIILLGNPVSESINLSVNMDEAKTMNLAVINIIGQTTYENRLTLVAGANQVQVPTSTFASGSYFVRLTDGKSVQSVKVVVSK